LVRSIAEKEGISMNELENINGSGQAGRVTKKDILDYVDNRLSAPAAISTSKVELTTTSGSPVITPTTASPAALPAENTSFLANIKGPVVIPNPGDEIIEMDRMRKIIAEHMVMSVHVAPHVTSYVEADVTDIVNWRNKIKGEFAKREGENITFTPIIIEAIVKAIKDFPMINVSVSGTTIIKRKDINIGMATALPSGNLIVPVIKNADRMNLTGLTKSVNELANNARNNKLKPEDIQGGTFTVTNVGSFGNVMGTPIINQPQVAILALGAIRKVPAVIETPHGDFIGIRHKMFLSHSYDHRVVDGSLGGQFVKRVADYLEQFDPNREL
jgi:2-oxoglutarate dehydrogenase E2 component (dihydrolipoamide succinyltransferase)